MSGVGGFMTKIEEGGGYDLSEIAQAREVVNSGQQQKAEEFEEVDPLYIEVIPNGKVARTEEYEARMVIVEYDEYDQVVSVELL